MNTSESLISTKELARLLGMSTATITYYINMGLFKVKDRSGNARLYDKRETISIFEKIYKLRKEGYSLRLIQKKLEKGYRI